jgi:transposase-like protein
MTRKYKKYDKEFKLEAAKLVREHGYSYVEAARQLGLEDWAVRGWVKALRKSGDLPPEPDEGDPSVAEDSKALRAENAKLRVENEILMKTAVYYTKDFLFYNLGVHEIDPP